jgi:hypothetical protein
MTSKDKLNQIANEVVKRMQSKGIVRESDREKEEEPSHNPEGAIVSVQEEAPQPKTRKPASKK